MFGFFIIYFCFFVGRIYGCLNRQIKLVSLVIYGGIAFDWGSGQSSPFGLTLNGKSQAPLKVDAPSPSPSSSSSAGSV